MIGSVYMEKGCDQVVGRRQKKKWMSWREAGSRGLGILRVADLNHNLPNSDPHIANAYFQFNL